MLLLWNQYYGEAEGILCSEFVDASPLDAIDANGTLYAEPTTRPLQFRGQATTTWSGTVTLTSDYYVNVQDELPLPHARMLFFLPASAFMLKAD